MNQRTTVADLLSVPRTDSITKVSSLISNHPLEKLRGISEKTFRLFDYCAGTFKGQPAQVANYRDDNGLTTAQHIRYGEKQFAWLGRDKKIKIQLFGQHLGTEGVLIICEGELDAMSVHEVLHRNRAKQRFVCCSIPDGASSAVKSVKAQLQWVLGFKKVVVFLDTDGPGREAASKLPEVIGPTVHLASGFAYKDPNEALQAGDEAAILAAINNASKVRPDAIVHAPDLLDQVLNPVDRMGLPFPWEGWNLYTHGMKPGEVYMISAGTGVGKSQVTRSIALYLAMMGIMVAYLGLEESCVTSLERMLSEALGFNPGFHLDTPEQRQRRDPKLIKDALDQFAKNVFLIDKFGSEDFDEFTAAIKHYVLGEGCRVVVLDHFSLLADGISLGVDQRRAIDRCIKDLKTLAVELGITMLVVAHLSRSSGFEKPHEEGGEPSLRSLRGSHSLAQIPDFCVMLQRNPTSEDEVEKNTTYCWLKKNRVKGELGLMAKLHYLPSCRFHEINS